MNGEAGDCRFHLAYDSTPGRKERDFFEQFVEDERGLPPISRRINALLVREFINVLGTSPYVDRMRRAIVQYVLALKYWSKGNEILAVAHLYMGIEALVPVVRRIEQERLSLRSTQELASHFGVPKKEVDGIIRKNNLFCGDAECYQAARKVSDGVEHGFLGFDEGRSLSVAVRNKVAAYLRTAIVRLLNLPEKVANGLLSKPYDTPIGTEGYIRYLRGHLLADHDELAPVGHEYPIVEWEFGVKEFSLAEDGQLRLSFSESMTPRIGKEVSFQLKSLEVYGPEWVVATPSAKQGIEPRIVRQDTDLGPKSQEELATLLREVLGRDKVSEVRIRTESNEIFVISRKKPSDDS